MILSAQSIRKLCITQEGIPAPLIEPFYERTKYAGKSFGLSSAGYDIRVQHIKDRPWSIGRMDHGDFLLCSSLERISIPRDIIAFVKDKSSWAREGLAVQNTVLEPGWSGWITLELSFHRRGHHIVINSGDPIAQLVFHRLDEPTEQPYEGKYQNQPDMPVESIYET